MKIKSLKSQVTMIMIAGLLMFIIVGIVLYISKGAIKKTSQQIPKKTQDTNVQNQPIKDFVTKCLEKTAKDGLALIGQQGGYVYKYQGGTLINFQESDEGYFFVRDGSFKVTYNIKNPTLYIPAPYSSVLPDYPWPNFPYAIPKCVKSNTNKQFSGIFGVSGMPFLYKKDGPHSLQTQMETFIDSNMAACLDFSSFSGYNIEVMKSKTEVIIGESDISVKTELPLTAKNTATKETMDIRYFSSSLNIRLKELYFFVKELVDKDIGDTTFNIKDAKNNRDGFSVTATEDVFRNDDLVTITDEKSLIYGQPMQHSFARKNRYPALYCIENKNLEFPDGHLITKEDLLQDSELKAEDPDEDEISYEIKALLPNPSLPTKLDKPYIQFRISANDGEYEDYQTVTIRRK